MIYHFLFSALLLILLCLDLTKKIDFTRPLPATLYTLALPHFPIAILYLFDQRRSTGSVVWLPILCMVVFHFYSTLRLHIIPFRHNETKSRRIGIEYGGYLLLRLSGIGILMQLAFYLFFYIGNAGTDMISVFPYFITTNRFYLSFDILYTIAFLWLFLVNGVIRILCTCYRLGIVKRILICLWMWVPMLNLLLCRVLARATKDEYDIALERHLNEILRVGSDCCQTKYPIIMVHGIGFRDLKYFNYWGRMPKVLIQNGATIYYGHQNAWGTIEENAAKIAQTIDKALSETGTNKVNIIAHSKGGLDSRYLISRMGYADKVASLTTMSTPHRGSALIDLLNRLPDGCYRFIAGYFDKSFSKFGDEMPDCYHASKQLAPAYCKSFNEQTKDSPLVYYQSYTSVMRGMLSDTLLSIPYLFMQLLSHEKNDGLVTVSSAKWGEFKGVFENSKRRGLSHGDMIDLKREDIKGFDILEKYVQIVEDLKDREF